MKRMEIMGFRGDPLVGYIYKEVKEPKAVVQILHGMQEHGKRYDNFAKYLNKKGYIVFVSDLRGHGESAKSVELQGHSEDIFTEIVNDQIIISNTLSQMFELPLYVLGHSFGSFVTQNYITQCHIANKIVLSGSAYTKNMAYKFGNIIAKINCVLVGKNKTAKLIEKVSFGSYGKKFPNGNWLTHDEEVFNKYVNDPYCGKPFPYSFYRSFFSGALSNYKNVDDIKKDTKILLLSGDADPVSNGGKLVSKLYDVYKKCGLDVTCKLYPGGRHEMLNETYKEEVYDYIIEFFEK